jgi:uncharacterized protein YciI
MDFDRFTIALLVTNPDPPELSEEEADAIQDAHLDFLATLHEAGHLLAAGPLRDPGGELRGLSILRGDVETVERLKAEDPAVRAGVFLVRVLPWQVPAGAAHFVPTRFPHSIADVLGD